MSQHRTLAVHLQGTNGILTAVSAKLVRGPDSIRMIGGDATRDSDTSLTLRVAIRESGIRAARGTIEVRTDPPHVRLTGGADLALAAGCLATIADLPPDCLAGTAFVGQLRSNGSVGPTRGVLAAVNVAAKQGARQVVVPAANLAEAVLVQSVSVRGVRTLAELDEWLRVQRTLPTRHMPGQHVLRAMEVAAVGGHHLLAVGKSSEDEVPLARRLHALLPDLSREEQLEVAVVQSLAGSLDSDAPLAAAPPFAAPHVTASVAALVGGGGRPFWPGAASLAHLGLLVLENLPDYRSERLYALRPALVKGRVELSGAGGEVGRFPARFLLCATANGCPCGQYPDSTCACTPGSRRGYLAQIPAGILDDIDVRVGLSSAQALQRATPESVELAPARVRAARDRASRRWATDCRATNAWVAPEVLAAHALPAALTRPIDRAYELGSLSRRAADRVLRLAWSAADLDGADQPGERHIAEALELRGWPKGRP